MARPTKQGINYFSYDVDLAETDEMRFLIVKHGAMAHFVYCQLLCKIYRYKGYFVEWNERTEMLFCSDWNIEVNVCRNLINDYINEGLFDKEIWEKYQILTSRRVQENFLKACERRKSVEMVKEWLLVDVKKIVHTKSVVNVNINSINDDINTSSEEVKGHKSTQKEKEKEKESLHFVSEDKNPEEAGLQVRGDKDTRMFILSKKDFEEQHWKYWLRKDIDFEEAYLMARDYCKSESDAIRLRDAIKKYSKKNEDTEEKFLLKFDTFLFDGKGAKVEYWAKAG